MAKKIGEIVVLTHTIENHPKVMVGHHVGGVHHGQPVIAITQRNQWEDKANLPDIVKLSPDTLQAILDWYHGETKKT